MEGKHDRGAIIEFIKKFDRAFDCLNVTKNDKQGKPDRRAYKSVNDPRFQVSFFLNCSFCGKCSKLGKYGIWQGLNLPNGRKC